MSCGHKRRPAAHFWSYHRVDSKGTGTFGPKLKYVQIISNHNSEPAKNGRRSRWLEMCSQKKTLCQTHADMSSISCTKTACKGARCTGIWIVFWTGEILLTRTRGAQHVVISSTVTALVFAVFIKCPMLSNEQCDKAPYGPVGAAWQPHSHAYHSPNLFDDGFTVSLVQCIFIPNKNWKTPKNYSRCQALRFMPWAERRCKQHLGLKMIQPQNSIWTEETS